MTLRVFFQQSQANAGQCPGKSQSCRAKMEVAARSVKSLGDKLASYTGKAMHERWQTWNSNPGGQPVRRRGNSQSDGIAADRTRGYSVRRCGPACNDGDAWRPE
jgi:hypothetical protein